MPKLNADENDLFEIRERLKVALGENYDLDILFASAELGLRAHHVLVSLRPLIAAVWTNMNERDDGNRFAVERMLKDIDQVINYWASPDVDDMQEEDTLSQ